MTITRNIYKTITLTEQTLTLRISLHEDLRSQEPDLSLLRMGELRHRVDISNLDNATQLVGSKPRFHTQGSWPWSWHTHDLVLSLLHILHKNLQF